MHNLRIDECMCIYIYIYAYIYLFIFNNGGGGLEFGLWREWQGSSGLLELLMWVVCVENLEGGNEW